MNLGQIYRKVGRAEGVDSILPQIEDWQNLPQDEVYPMRLFGKREVRQLPIPFSNSFLHINGNTEPF